MKQTGVKIKCQTCGKVLKVKEVLAGAGYGTCQKCIDEYLNKIASKADNRIRHCKDAI
jgi:hypothetical protein